jgi:hypothetical protein
LRFCFALFGVNECNRDLSTVIDLVSDMAIFRASCPRAV